MSSIAMHGCDYKKGKGGGEGKYKLVNDEKKN